MFEKYVSSIILTLANKYIKNVNASELKLSLWGAPPAAGRRNQSVSTAPPRKPCARVSMAPAAPYTRWSGEHTESPAVSARRWRGDAEQRRAADRGPAQDELETPLTFKRIFIQEPKLNVAWASLRYQPAKVSSHPRRLLGSAQLARQPVIDVYVCHMALLAKVCALP